MRSSPRMFVSRDCRAFIDLVFPRGRTHTSVASLLEEAARDQPTHEDLIAEMMAAAFWRRPGEKVLRSATHGCAPQTMFHAPSTRRPVRAWRTSGLPLALREDNLSQKAPGSELLYCVS